MSFALENWQDNQAQLHQIQSQVEHFSDKQASQSGNISTELLVWGSDEYGQLGLGHKYVKQANEKILKVPKSCTFSIVITDIACGEDFAFLLTAKGHLYGMGSNQFGKLGI